MFFKSCQLAKKMFNVWSSSSIVMTVGVFYTILVAFFPVFLRGILIQVKMSLYKLMGLDHFRPTIEEKY